MIKVLMNDFKSEPEQLIQAEISACEKVFRSGFWILGKEVTAFENAWSNWLHVAHTVGCGNGMDAIEICLRSLDIGSGDEVITTPMTAFATVLAIMRAGATPVLADIDPLTAMLDPLSVKRCLSKQTRAILLVNLYGLIGPIEELTMIASAENIRLIEDCAQCHGAKIGEKRAGSFGIAAAWSFYPTKNLGAVGDSGALTTNNHEIAEKAKSLRNYGQTVRYKHPMFGMNSRLDELHAAILLERLKYLDQWIQKRRNIAQRYIMGIKNANIRFLTSYDGTERHVYHLFVVTCDQRDALQQHLAAAGIDSLIHYPIPVHHQAPTLHLPRDPKGLEASENHANTCISLPCHPSMTDIQVSHVINVINNFCR